MSGRVAQNPQTGEIWVLTPAGAWETPQRARNPQTGAEYFYDGSAWQDVPAKPEPPTSMGRALGLGVRDVAEGLMAVPNMVLGAPQALRNLGASALGLPAEPTYSDRTAAALDALRLPRPETTSERRTSAISRNVAAALPTLGAGAVLQGAGRAPALAEMLVGNIPSQVAGAVGSGAAGQAAAEGGYGPVGQMVAGLAGGVGGAVAMQGAQGVARGAAAAVQPFREEGRRAIAADVLLRSSADPEGLPGRITQGMDDTSRRLPGSPVTTAQAARDPGLMVLESGMRSQTTPNTPTGASPAIALRNVEAQRNTSRLSALSAMQDGSEPGARGAAVRGGLNASDDAMGARVDQAFNIARDRNSNRYSTQPIMDVAGRVTRIFDPRNGGGGVPGELQNVMDDVAALSSLSLDQAQNLRSRVMEIAGKASAAGDNRLASAASAVGNAIEATVDDPRWMQAVALRREQGQAVGRNEAGASVAGQVLRTDRFGAPMMPDEAVPGRVLQSPAAARQVMEAHYKAIDDARRARLPADQIEALRGQMAQTRTALRGQFIDDMMRAASTTADMADSAGNVSRVLSPAGFRRFWEQNQATAAEIFERGQLAQLRRLASDFAETGMVTRTASAAGSPTAQNLSVANMIARGSNGLLDPGMPLAQTIGSLGGLMRIVYAAPEAATRELLTQAVTDPRFAQLLLARASPANVARAARYVEMNMMDRLTEAAIGASGRAAIRAGTAEATRPEQPPQPR